MESINLVMITPKLLIDDGPHDLYLIHAFHDCISYMEDEITCLMNLFRRIFRGPASGGQRCFRIAVVRDVD